MFKSKTPAKLTNSVRQASVVVITIQLLSNTVSFSHILQIHLKNLCKDK